MFSEQWSVLILPVKAVVLVPPSLKLITVHWSLTTVYFVSLCGWCFRQRLQNFLNSRRHVVVFLFFVVE